MKAPTPTRAPTRLSTSSAMPSLRQRLRLGAAGFLPEPLADFAAGFLVTGGPGARRFALTGSVFRFGGAVWLIQGTQPRPVARTTALTTTLPRRTTPRRPGWWQRLDISVR